MFLDTVTSLAKKGTGIAAREFRQAVLDAVKDGKLTKEEIDALETQREALGLPIEILDSIRVQAYVIAFQTVQEDQEVTDDEWDELQQIQDYLGLNDSDIAKTKKELLRLRVLTEIHNGNVPIVDAPSIILKNTETSHWTEEVMMMDHTKKKIDGSLIITDQRIIFRGADTSFAVLLSQILDVEYGDTGMRIHQNRHAPVLFHYKEPQNHDIVGSVLFAMLAKKVESREKRLGKREE